MENKNILQLSEFYSVCSQMVFHSGKIMQEVFNPNGTISKTKHGDEPFTEADVKVQTLLIKGLRTIWPDIKIIGEEDEVSDNLVFDFNSLRRDEIPKDLLTGAKTTEIDLSKAIVWIDPLDGTIEFIRGALDCVTTLIGISVDGEAKVGVVGKYFSETEPGKYQWDPRCYFGSVDHPHLYCVDYEKGSKIEEVKPKSTGDSNKLIICTTRNHMSAELQEKLDRVAPDEVVKVGGAGNKILHVIEGKSDTSFYPKPGMKRWDICAGEAILRSIGGIVTDGTNEQIKYYEEKTEWPCLKGVVSSISSEKHNRVMEALLKVKPTL